MSDAEDLSLLANESPTITISGKTMKLNRVRMKQLSRVLALAQPMADKLFKKTPAPKQGKQADESANLIKEGINIANLVVAHGDELVQLIAEIQSYGNDDITAEWIENLEIDEVITLAGAVFEVNLDFFIQRVVPALSQALASLNAGVQLKVHSGSMPTRS